MAVQVILHWDSPLPIVALAMMAAFPKHTKLGVLVGKECSIDKSLLCHELAAQDDSVSWLPISWTAAYMLTL